MFENKSIFRALFNIVIILSLLVGAIAFPNSVSANSGVTERVSVDSNGNQANNESYWPDISSNGRYVTFFSWANNLVANDTNYTNDVFVRDLQTGETKVVSISSQGELGNMDSSASSISDDGRYVVFQSRSTNLVVPDTNGQEYDIFLHDLQTGETSLISVDSNGIQASQSSYYPIISGDGRYVSFVSSAKNLVTLNSSNYNEIFVHDRVTGITKQISVTSNGNFGNDSSYGAPKMSEDGQFILFVSNASNLVPGDTNGVRDVFMHNQLTGETIRVSVGTNGVETNNRSEDYYDISSNGRFVGFTSYATNLVEDDTNGVPDIFVYDTKSYQTTRVSSNSNGIQSNGFSYYSSLSSDGRYVTFFSDGSNLVSDDNNGEADIFRHDLLTGETIRVSVDTNGNESTSSSEGSSGSDFPSISGDGSIITFVSYADKLVLNDTNNQRDIFIRQLVSSSPSSMRYVTTDGTDTGDCGNSANPCASITYAISQAVAGNTIEIGAGTYTEAGITVDKDLTITGAGASNTIVQATSAPRAIFARVFTISPGVTTIIEEMTIRHGSNSGGGGIYNDGGTLNLINTVLTTNYAYSPGGGGIYNKGTLTITDSVITDNSAEYYGGGVVNADGGVVMIYDSSITNNDAYYGGGGIYNINSSMVTLMNTVIIGNIVGLGAAGDGGGIYNTATLVVNDSLIINNQSGRDGGGIYNSSGTITISFSKVSDNQSYQNGGGIYNNYFGELIVNASTIKGNSSGFGGGIFNNGILTTMVVNNTTISGNSATAHGGGVMSANDARLELNYSTIADNTSGLSGVYGEGGGIYNTGSLIAKSNIVIGNRKGIGGELDPNADCYGVGVSGGYNLLASGTGCSPFGTGNLVIAPSEAFTNILNSLSDNGYPMQTHALIVNINNPALNAIPNGTNDCGTAPFDLDQRGEARPFGTGCDIGAYEAQSAPPTTVDQTITVIINAPISAVAGDEFTVEATASSGLPVTYGAKEGCINIGATFTMTASTGICKVHYFQSGNANYNPAPMVIEEVVLVNSAPVIVEGESINVTMSEDGDPTPFELRLNAIDADNDALTWSISSPASNGTAIIITKTKCDGKKAANPNDPKFVCKDINYTPTLGYSGTDSFEVRVDDGNLADTITVNVIIEPTIIDQTITVTTNAPSSASLGDIFTVEATADSGLPVTYSSSGACSNVEGEFTIISVAGDCMVMYDQAGDATYNPAPQIIEIVSDGTPPQVISIVRASPNPTSSNSVDYTVTFSESATGVDVTDFTLSTTGISGALVSQVNGSGEVYTVSAETGTGNGTMRLDVADDDSIIDSASNSLSSAFTTGEVYDVDKGNSTPPSKPTLVSPANGSLSTDYTPLFDWNNSTLPVGTIFSHYQLQVATDSLFTSIVFDVNVADINNSEFTPASDLASNTKFYWRVRAVNLFGNASAWSNVRNFDTALVPPTLLSPSDAEQLSNNRPVFNWEDVSGVTGYRIEISSDAVNFTSPIIANVTASEYVRTSDLPAGQILYWRVRSKGTNGPSAWSAVWSITTANPPSAPILSTPTNGLKVSGPSPVFGWNDSTVPVGTEFDYYQIQIATENTFTNIVHDNNVTASQDNIAVLASGTTYYWRVRAFNTLGQASAWSNVRSVKIKFAGPTLTSPASGVALDNLLPTFIWDAVSGATEYTIQVSKNNLFSGTKVINTNTLLPTYIHIANLQPNTTYYWRVRVKSPTTYGPGDWSQVFTFTTP